MTSFEKNVNGPDPLQRDFEAAAKPLIKWLNDHGHPHMTIIVSTTHAELLEGVVAINTHEFVKD